MKVSACVVGGVMLDIVTHLRGFDIKDFENNKQAYAQNPVEWLAGGSGTNLALAANSCGFGPVSVVCKLGFRDQNGQPDMAGQVVLNELRSKGIDVIYCGDPNVSTGTSMITYINDDMRLLVADNEAEASFCSSDLTDQILKSAASADVVIVSGYTLLNETQRQASLVVMREAKKAAAIVALDVVPHKIYQYLTTMEFDRLTEPVNVLIAEANTLKRLFPGLARENEASGIARYLLERYQVVIVQSWNSKQLVFDKDGLIESSDVDLTAIQGVKQRAIWDRLSVEAIHRHYERISKAVTG